MWRSEVALQVNPCFPCPQYVAGMSLGAKLLWVLVCSYAVVLRGSAIRLYGRMPHSWERYMIDELLTFTSPQVVVPNCTDADVVTYYTPPYRSPPPRHPSPEGVPCSAKIMLHIGDELCIWRERIPTYAQFRHVFRQYACWSAFSADYAPFLASAPRTLTILPLAYTPWSRPLEGTLATIQAALRGLHRPRILKWSFVGNMHLEVDRRYCLGLH